MNVNKKFLAMAVLCTIASVGFVLPASAEETMTHDLDEVIVEADRDALPGGFIKSSGQVGLLGRQNIMDIPFQQTNLTAKTIAVFSANPSEASTSVLVSVPSIRTAGSTVYNDFSIRGQAANAYQFRINGIPGMFSQTNIPMNFFEAVDVTSGASVGINGVTAQESAGGTINMVTKRAHDNSIKYTTGFSGRSTWSNYIDISNRFGRNKENGLRINASHVDGDTGIASEEVRNTTFSLNYDRETRHAETNLFLGYRDTRTSQAQRYFDFSNAAITHMPKAPKNSNNYGFDGETVGMKTYLFTLNHLQKLTDKTSLFLNAGSTYNDGYDYVVPASTRLDVINDNGDFTRTINNEPFAIRNSYIQFGLKQDWEAGSVKNKLVLAYDKDWYAAQWGSSNSSKGAVTGNIFTGNVTVDKITENLTGPLPSGKSHYYGWSAINESTLGKAIVTLGVHRHTSSVTSSAGLKTKTDATAPLYGIVYKPTERVSLFANHTESFQAGKIIGNSYNNRGNVLSPAKTKSNEIGIKYGTSKFIAGLSYFDMKKQAEFEDGNGNLTLNGDLKYKGLELTLGGEIAPKWSLTGGFLYTDSKYNNNNTAYLDGSQVIGTSKFSAVGTLQYAPDEKSSIFGRMVYTGKAPIYTTAGRELTVSSSTVFDLGANYKTKINNTPVTFTATVFNVFNKDYWLPRATYNYGILGNPRTVAVCATFEI